MRARDFLFEELVDYSSHDDHVAAAQRVCDMVKAKSKRLPIRIELKPEIRYGTCQGIFLTDLYAKEPGNGAGTELMNLLAKLADEAGLNIYVNAEGPRSAAFYEKMGYERDSSGHHQFVKYASFDHDAWLNESYKPNLSTEELIDHAWQCAHEDEVDEISPDVIFDMFDGFTATLRVIPLADLQENQGVEIAYKKRQYRKLTTEAPPIIVRPTDTGYYIVDGNHRVRDAMVKKKTHISAYVMEPEPEALHESIEPSMAQKILDDWRCKRGVKIGNTARLWRGQSSESGSGMATLGMGFYFTCDRRVAARYAGDDGEVIEVSRTELPDNALRFATTGDYEIWLQRAQRLLGYKDNRDFVKDYNDIGVFVRSLDPSIEGIQMFTGKDAMFVSYASQQGAPEHRELTI